MSQQKSPVKHNNSTTRVAANRDMLAVEHVESELPHPSIVEQYDRMVPGAAQLIFDDYIANAQAVRQNEAKGLDAAIERDKRGQLLAFGVAVMMSALAAYALYTNHPVVAGGALLAPLGLLGSSFLKK